MSHSTVIRVATSDDRPSARRLIRDFLVDMHERGSEVVPSFRSIDFYSSLFDAYASGEILGAVIIATINSNAIGLSMTGHVHPLDLSFGQTATGWVTYVAPAYRGTGIASEMRGRLRDCLRAQGFVAIAAGYHTWNESSRQLAETRGFKSVQMYGYEPIGPEEENS